MHPHCIRKYTNTCSHSSVSSTSPSESKRPRWDLKSAVCLERYPVVSQELGEIERKFSNMLETMELENSLLSDHEVQVIQDKYELAAFFKSFFFKWSWWSDKDTKWSINNYIKCHSFPFYLFNQFFNWSSLIGSWILHFIGWYWVFLFEFYILFLGCNLFVIITVNFVS